MISTEEKEKIKKEIVEKVNSFLEKNCESYRIDKVNIINKNRSLPKQSFWQARFKIHRSHTLPQITHKGGLFRNAKSAFQVCKHPHQLQSPYEPLSPPILPPGRLAG